MGCAHCVAVAVLSCAVARLNGWSSAGSQAKISIAGLLHDIGLREVPPEILRAGRARRTQAETVLFENHPLRGRDIVAQLKGLPEDIPQIVSQCHETLVGTGYPARIRGDQLHPLARLIGTVDRFVEMVIPIGGGAAALEPQEALRQIQRLSLEGVDAMSLRGLMTIFKFDAEKRSA